MRRPLIGLHLPWGRGLGRLGLGTPGGYRDYGFRGLRLTKFQAVYDVMDRSHVTHRSWYILTLRGWRLTRREDAWGEWRVGRGHKPALRERPEYGYVRAFELRAYFKPYQMIDWYGERLEVISYPSPEKDRAILMVREKDDPTTMREVVLEEYYEH